MNIYLACHIENSHDTQTKKSSIRRTVKEYLGEEASLLAEEEGKEKSTLVFSVERPFFTEASLNAHFFSRIEKLMTVLSDFSPHFTQGQHYSPELAEKTMSG